jgi:tRNA (guanine37-N1)-methyltransferase
VKISIISLFPEAFAGPLSSSILGRAAEAGLLDIEQVDIRDFATDKHSRVDDRPYGGGPGMVLMAEPLALAIESVKASDSKVIHLSPQGTPLTAAVGRRCSEEGHLILLCGHYEGVDERILELYVDQEISIGDYVLTNGALAAMVLIDVMARFIPGVIGDEEGPANDSFEEGIFDCPHYTRPPEFRGKEVPSVLLSGDHAAIEKWRRERAEEKTRQVRPDLLECCRYESADPRN